MKNQELEKFVAQRNIIAQKIINESLIPDLWQQAGAKVNLVGSMAMGLLCKHNDIDFHIYTPTLDRAIGLSVMGKICLNPKVMQMSFNDLSQTNQACIEWHLWYQFQDELWQLDLIQILQGSEFDGYFEHVANRIKMQLTPEIKETILQLKYETPEDVHASGIEYYQAVISDHIKTYAQFQQWRKNHPQTEINLWCP